MERMEAQAEPNAEKQGQEISLDLDPWLCIHQKVQVQKKVRT